MAQLTHLPTEIILHIISFVQSYGDIAALAAQSSHLYQACDMRARERFRQIRITNNAKHLESAFAALMDILKQPYLGRYVRHIEYWEPVTMAYRHPPSCEFDASSPAEEDMEMIRAAIYRAGFPDRGIEPLITIVKQISGVTHRREKEEFHSPLLAQVLTALLISVAPEVESMALSQPFPSQIVVPWQTDPINHKRIRLPLHWLLHQVNNRDTFPGARGPKLLRKLRDVYLIDETCDTSWIEDEAILMTDVFDFINLFRRLPSIESIGMDGLRTNVVGKHGVSFASSNITRIRIEHSTVDSMDLASIICLCKQLREFGCSIGAELVGGDLRGTWTAFRIVFQALLVHRTTLELLHIDAAYIDLNTDTVERVLLGLSEDFEKRGQMGAIRIAHEMALIDRQVKLPVWIWDQAGSLADFSALKHLDLEIQYLLYMARGVRTARDDEYQLADRLPPKLEHLLINAYEKNQNENFDKQVDSLRSSEREQRLSSLKTILGIDPTIPVVPPWEEGPGLSAHVRRLIEDVSDRKKSK
ncbi:uncharacterized protein BO72DRAFT_517467 [Aspergillus fijiensis CBS 313.89]|uniref:F-box domain-containing protein n=1 Tax=Aspergillus fijiensis CBS 313.89 TaxID=1448319 RepID=A0A8G1RL40_9EURO|nr:uncharacterized protein BO72DRAFT_517467 [Aspergillus fijiensis CBS 313.89]RAK73765.1 hypothetical protein BO72DRAFT_517467 [Aspergillus fijiensis CBS 313.89]